MNSSKSLSIACLIAASLIAAVSCKKEFDKMVVENTALQDKAFVKVARDGSPVIPGKEPKPEDREKEKPSSQPPRK